MKIIWPYFQNLMNKQCTHSSAKKGNCRYCPDCGEKVVHKWIIIKCRVCGHYRKPLLDSFGTIKPAKKYCFYCGSNKWDFHYYYNDYIPDKMKIIAVKKVQSEAELKNKFGKLTEKTRVWVTRFF